MNTSLPIYNYKEEIINAVNTHAVTIITAETGSGKSTQVPQYLHEAGYDVVITEPRRMAAWSLAERVAEEMETEFGDIVGFRTGFERKDSPNTSVLYCTDGLELVRTLTAKNDSKNKVLVIDEVHEWNLNIETLIAWSKKKISENWSTKVVIMSATLEKTRLSNYFGQDVAVFDIPGKLFPVKFIQRSEDYLTLSIKELIAEGRNTLVFVPGKKEIADVISNLSDSKAVVLPLHGELDSEEQKKCFQHYTLPKVVVSTNVAQTSITIPDIDAVVDTGKERQTNVIDGIQGLFLKDISQADCLQRKGRAGRTKEGIYILCSDTKFEYRDHFSIPEIQRGILDQIVLRLATCGIDATQLEFFHQPSSDALNLAKSVLIDLGALTADNEVTPIGYKMAKMPVSVQSARMIIEAEKYGVTEEVITIASILEIGTLLTKQSHYSDFTDENESDLLAELDIYNALQGDTADVYSTLSKRTHVPFYTNKKGAKVIDLKRLGINMKNYFRIKEHIQKMHQSLEGIIEIVSSTDRKAIKRACLSGMLNHVYHKSSLGYVNGDGISRNLEKKSCMFGWNAPSLLVGTPKIIEFTDCHGFKRKLNLVCNATKVTLEELQEIAPYFFTQEDINPYYSSYSDGVCVTRIYRFKGIEIERTDVLVKDHPDYETLKNEHEAKQAEYSMSYSSESLKKDERQKTVFIDEKPFEVHYRWGEVYIELDLYTLYHTDVKNVYLENGQKVSVITTDMDSWKTEDNIVALRNIKENKRISYAWKRLKDSLPKNASTNSSISSIISSLGQKEVTRSNGGYGEPIYGYVCLTLSKSNSLQFQVLEDETSASENTKEAIEFLFGKIIIEKYSEKKFRFKKACKGLSPKEKKVKEEFDSEVREMLKGLSVDNIEERLDYLDEYYHVLIEDLKIA